MVIKKSQSIQIHKHDVDMWVYQTPDCEQADIVRQAAEKGHSHN